MIDSIQLKIKTSIRRICSVLNIPRSSYNAAAQPSPTQLADQALGTLIFETFQRYRRRYGYGRIHNELTELGYCCAPSRVRRLMKEQDLRALQPKSFTPRTNDGKANKPSDNLLKNRAEPNVTHEVWAGDITHIPTNKGWHDSPIRRCP